MIDLLNPDIIGRGGVKLWKRQADVLLIEAHKAGYFHGKTYYNRLHSELMTGAKLTIRFFEHQQKDRILETYYIIARNYEGKPDHRDAICSYLLSMIVVEPNS